MESYYGIGVKNRYEMFYDDDSDPVDLLKKTQAKKKEKAEKDNKTKEKPKESPKKPEKHANGNVQEKRSEGTQKDANRDKKDFKKTERVRFAEREEQNNLRNSGENVVKEAKEKDAPTNPKFNGEGRGRGRGGGDRGGNDRGTNSEFGRGRGNRRGRGGVSDRGGKREFDRQSGMVTSGVKSVDKKEGAGSFNWGSNKEQINFDGRDHQENDTRDNIPDKGKKNTGDKYAQSETKENDSPKEEEEAVKEMTLDEWKALQKRDRPQFNVRKAGEGENSDQWKKTYVLNKKKIAENVEEAPGETPEVADAPQTKRKVLLPIDFQFSDAPGRGAGRFRGRGGGGGPGGAIRGGGRGRGNRGSGAGGRFVPLRPEAPKMDDEKVFPSLG